MSDPVLAEQLDYYRARAPEYDDWWQRRGRYDRGAQFQDLWDRDVTAVTEALRDFEPTGRVIELAAGTGNWTRELVAHADELVVVDGSAETLDINRAKLAASGADLSATTFVDADLFAWEVPSSLRRRFDTVFFSFWLTHVPDDRFEAFWSLVHELLAPGGRVRLLDNAHPARAVGIPGSPLEVHYPTEESPRTHVSTGQGAIDLDDGTAARTLADGRRFTIVKRFWRPAELTDRLAALGWTADLDETEHFFLHGSAVRAT